MRYSKRHPFVRSFAALLFFLGTIASSALAQRQNSQLREVSPSDRHGLWVGLGGGVGGESFDVLHDGLGYSNTLYKPTLSLKLGGTLGPHLRLGGEASAWFDQEGRVLQTISSLMVIAQVYPAADAGFFLKGGAGLGRNGYDFRGGYGGQSDVGVAGDLGAGWELRAGRNFYLVPTVDVTVHSYSGRTFSSYRERVLNFGLSLVFQ